MIFEGEILNTEQLNFIWNTTIIVAMYKQSFHDTVSEFLHAYLQLLFCK